MLQSAFNKLKTWLEADGVRASIAGLVSGVLLVMLFKFIISILIVLGLVFAVLYAFAEE